MPTSVTGLRPPPPVPAPRSLVALSPEQRTSSVSTTRPRPLPAHVRCAVAEHRPVDVGGRRQLIATPTTPTHSVVATRRRDCLVDRHHQPLRLHPLLNRSADRGGEPSIEYRTYPIEFLCPSRHVQVEPDASELGKLIVKWRRIGLTGRVRLQDSWLPVLPQQT